MVVVCSSAATIAALMTGHGAPSLPTLPSGIRKARDRGISVDADSGKVDEPKVPSSAMLTPVVRTLLLLNGILYLAELLYPNLLIGWLALWPGGLLVPSAAAEGTPQFLPWQIITYAFLHGGVLHLALNMYALWLFGSRLEYLWGSQKFAVYYLSCVIGAALTQLVVSEITLLQGGQAYPVLGASGGVFGLLVAFGMLFPEARLILLFPPVPIKAKWFVIGYGVIELLAGVTGTMMGVAHFAHLGGMVTGYLLLRYWRGAPPRR